MNRKQERLGGIVLRLARLGRLREDGAALEDVGELIHDIALPMLHQEGPCPVRTPFLGRLDALAADRPLQIGETPVLGQDQETGGRRLDVGLLRRR